MRKAVRLSQLLEKIADHVIVKQEHIIGFLLDPMGKRIEPISNLSMPNSYQGLAILPYPITDMPKSLKQFAEFIELLDTFLHIQMDAPIAGYVALCIDPLSPSNVISKQHIWMALDSPDELIEIEFTDGSCITVSESQLRLLDYAMDLNVVKTVHVLTS